MQRCAAEFLTLDGTAAGRAVFMGGHEKQFFRRGERVHLLTAAAASLVSNTGMQLVSAGSAVLEPGVGSKSTLVEEEEHAGAGYVVPQAALTLALRWVGTRGSDRVVKLSPGSMRELLQAKRSGTHGGRLRCAVDDDEEQLRLHQGMPEAEGIGEGAMEAVFAMPAGGCIALLVAEEEEESSDAGGTAEDLRSGTVALSCWKSDPCWLQISNGSDKAALAAVAAQLNMLDPPTQAE